MAYDLIELQGTESLRSRTTIGKCEFHPKQFNEGGAARHFLLLVGKCSICQGDVARLVEKGRTGFLY
jgi:hypothetical protein